MANKITEKYFVQRDFSKERDRALDLVRRETGFVVEREIYRGVIYDKTKVGSLIYKGRYKGRPAVLKLQGLKPETDEAKMLKSFMAQNRSRKIRVPKIFAFKSWSKTRGFGYLIIEYISTIKIFTMPFASNKEMKDFCKFYQDFRTKAVIKPWFKAETKDSLKFAFRRLDHWQKISKSKGRLKRKDFQVYVGEYKKQAKRHFFNTPMVFTHGHLSANDIYRLPKGNYILMSNLFWSFRPQWYDLAFNLWACIQHIRDPQFSFNKLLRYLQKWLATYQTVPVVKKDPDFKRKFFINLLERSMGSILVDLGVSDIFDKKENKKYFQHLLKLHQQLFGYLVNELNKF